MMHNRAAFISLAALVSGGLTAPLKERYISNCDADEKKRSKPKAWDYNWDMRKDSGAAEQSKAIHQIVLIRHGQYNLDGNSDQLHTLTELGHEQAKQTGRRIAELLQPYQSKDSKEKGKNEMKSFIHPIRNIYYSTMTRATQTFQDIFSELPVENIADTVIEPCSMLREGAVTRPIPSATTNWDVSDEDFYKDGIRAEAAFRRYFHRAAPEEKNSYSTVLVCHGNMIRYLVMRALQLPPEAWLRTAVYHASITIIEIYPSGRVSLRALGDVGHFPREMITYF